MGGLGWDFWPLIVVYLRGGSSVARILLPCSYSATTVLHSAMEAYSVPVYDSDLASMISGSPRRSEKVLYRVEELDELFLVRWRLRH